MQRPSLVAHNIQTTDNLKEEMYSKSPYWPSCSFVGADTQHMHALRCQHCYKVTLKEEASIYRYPLHGLHGSGGRDTDLVKK